MNTDMRLNTTIPPRNAKNAQSHGSYALVAEADSPSVRKGDTIVLKLFMSGYGAIFSPKLLISIPPNLHDEDQSLVYFDLEPTIDNKLVLGAHSQKLPMLSVQSLGGIGASTPGWEQPTYMIDTRAVTQDDAAPAILTETIQNRAPFELHVKIKKIRLWQRIRSVGNKLWEPTVHEGLRNPKPGKHTVQFVLTYFNGSEWRSDKTTYDIIVSSLYERHTLATWFIAIVAALTALLVAVLQLLVDVFTYKIT